MTYNAQRALGLIRLSSGLPAQRPNLPRPSGTAWQRASASGGCWLGRLVRQGESRDRHFANVLVAACVQLVRDWNPKRAPAWVTLYSFPSTSRSGTRLRPAAGRGIEPAVPLGTGKDGRPTRAKDYGQQPSTGPEYRWFAAGHRRGTAHWAGPAGGRHGGFGLDPYSFCLVAALTR